MERISFDDFLKGSASGKYNALPQMQELALNTYGQSSELTKPEPKPKPETKGVNREAYVNPQGSFGYRGKKYKLIDGQWKILNDDGSPMLPGQQADYMEKNYSRPDNNTSKPGQMTGRSPFFDRFRR